MADLSVEVEPEKFVLLEVVAKAAEALGIPWLLAGAWGRVLLMEILRKCPQGKATEDLDFGVMVRSWKEYRDLRTQICRDRRFRDDPKEAQRILFDDTAKLDLIPFGGLAVPDESIHWPTDGGVVMNVLGFQEACDTALPITVNGRLKVPVATAQAMLLLKLIAWEDRHVRRAGRDAPDIAYFLYHGEKIIGRDAFHEEYAQATEAVGWDLDLASARIFGLQMASIASDCTRRHLLSILSRQLVQGEESMLVREVAADFPAGRRDPPKALILLHQVQAGLVGEITP